MYHYSSYKYIIMICISISIAFLYILAKQDGTYPQWMYPAEDTPRIVYINENITNDNHYEDYGLAPGILPEEIHEDDAENINDEEEGEITWLKTMHDRFALRNALLKEQCQILKENLIYSLSYTLRGHIFMATHYNLLLCLVGKAGTTTWKSHLTWLNTGKKTIIKEEILARKLIPESELMERMFNKTFMKVMNVRHPLQRLVSAYRDKLKDGATNVGGNFKELIDEYLPKNRRSTGITFTEFLQLIVAEQKDGVQANLHWDNFYKVCSPCTIPYDYILQLETHDEDIRYIFKMAGISARDAGLRKHPTSNTNNDSETESKYWLYYKDVSDNLLRKIYHIYKEDFQLFGYEIPQFLQNVIKNEM